MGIEALEEFRQIFRADCNLNLGVNFKKIDAVIFLILKKPVATRPEKDTSLAPAPAKGNEQKQ